MQVPFLNPNITSADIAAATKVLRSGWLAVGPELTAFEEQFATYLNMPYVVANSSGTAALHTALLAAGIGPGDEVVTTPLTWWGTSNAIIYTGATPVFADVDPDTGLLLAENVERKINIKTKAIMPVHIYGQMVDMNAFSKLAKKYKLKIIEDAPHALEGSREGVRPGSRSFAACFSFHAAKNITSGEGGAVAVHDQKTARVVRELNDSGADKSGKIRQSVRLGYKYSITNMQGALLLSQLDRIEKQWKTRRSMYDYYQKELRDIVNVKLLDEVPNSKHGCHMFTIHVSERRRDAIRQELGALGVGTSIHYNPVHLEPYYKKTFGYKRGDYPVAEALGFSCITLPLYVRLTKVQQKYVVDSVKKVV